MTVADLGSHLPATRRARATQTFDRLIPYWKQHAEHVFPDLITHTIGWGEPCCFRCGWLVPLRDSYSGEWRKTGPWLEFAHLQDFALDGVCDPENVVPLCILCHRSMPRLFGVRERAIEWVKQGQPNSCPWWWQTTTDDIWGGQAKISFPGYRHILELYLRASERAARVMQQALALQDAEADAA